MIYKKYHCTNVIISNKFKSLKEEMSRVIESSGVERRRREERKRGGIEIGE